MIYWKNKLGKKIAIVDMDNSYIENCIKLLEKCGTRYEKEIYYFKDELRLRGLGKPIGEDFPLDVIQSWELPEAVPWD